MDKLKENETDSSSSSTVISIAAGRCRLRLLSHLTSESIPTSVSFESSNGRLQCKSVKITNQTTVSLDSIKSML
jgi:hypothetical protein